MYTLGSQYVYIDKINVVISILFNGENISFDPSLVIYIYIYIYICMYVKSTSIPPIIIMNKMYENQNFLCIVPLMRLTIVV